MGYLYITLSAAFWYEAFVLKLETVNEYILQMCNVEVSVCSTKKRRNYGDLNLDEFEIFSNIYTTLCPRHFGMKSQSFHFTEKYFSARKFFFRLQYV